MATITAGATGNWSAPGTWIGGIVPGPGDVARPATFNVTIDVDITVATLEATAAGRFLVSTARTITANVVNTTGASSNGVITFSHGVGVVCNLIGNITCNSPNATAPGVVQTGAGTLNITGNVVAGSVGINGYGIYNSAGGAMVLTGSLTGGVSSGSYGAYNSAGGSLTLNGDAVAGAGTSSVGVVNASSGTLTVNGNVTASNGNSAYGALNSSSGTLVVTGRATGGNNSNAVGALNNSNGTMTVGVAVGNGYGPGGTSAFSLPGVSATNTTGNVTRVYATESGPYGQVAIIGPVLMIANPATNQAVFRTAYNGPTLTLTDPAASADWPEESDVRLGVEYDLGDKTGTCAVPGASSVALGIAVDATTGTAVLTQAAVEDAAEAVLAAYDPPTQAELDARTLPAASYATAAGVAAAQAAVLAAIAALEDVSAADVETAALAALEAAVIEGALTLPEALRICLAFAAGATEGAGEDTLIYKSLDGAKDRITMTVDNAGDRSAVVLDVTP